MKFSKSMVVMGTICFAFASGGCSGGRDVEVSGTLTAASSVSVGDRLIVDFFDQLEGGSVGAPPDRLGVVLSRLGEFKQIVSLEGDQVDIRALDDQDGNGSFSVGEAWVRVT